MDLNLESAKRQEFRDILVTLASSQAILEQKNKEQLRIKISKNFMAPLLTTVSLDIFIQIFFQY